MKQCKFTFGTNLSAAVVTVYGATMRHAMHLAAKRLCVAESNLVFKGVC